MTIDPHGAPIGGCRPGEAPGDASIHISPNLSSSGTTTFVGAGTQVELVGSSKVRLWTLDCRFSDHNCRSIRWALLYQPIGGAVTDVTSLLHGGADVNPNAFVAGLPGRFQILLSCLELAQVVASSNILVGSSWTLESQATIWFKNDFIGGGKVQRGVHAVLVQAPTSVQVLAQVDTIIVDSTSFTPRSADGTFDSVSGALSLHLVEDVSGSVSGNVDIVLSTEGNITPPGESSISGKRRDSNGNVMLVGDAPLTGPIGNTHVWLQVSGTLRAV